MSEQAFDVVPTGPTEVGAARRFARAVNEPPAEDQEQLPATVERTISVRALRDVLSLILVVLGLATLSTAAWFEGLVPGLAATGGSVLILGLLLGFA